jgi:hypothetical protein
MRIPQLSVMLALALSLGSTSAVTGCGDDNPTLQDAGSNSNATFTSFVIDLVLNHGSDATPAPFTSFSTLPDPDGSDNNPNAYNALF